MRNPREKDPIREMPAEQLKNIGCLYCRKTPGKCPICAGAGKVPTAKVAGGSITSEECHNCKGTGKCPCCHGKSGKRVKA